MRIARFFLISGASWLAAVGCSAEASGGRAGPVDSTYVRECGECHSPYPARWLSAESWRHVLANLSRHFGQDASLDAEAQQKINDYLVSHGRRQATVAPDGGPLLRITESPGFLGSHDEVSPATWKRSDVQSPARCGACHGKAAQGSFSEHDLHLPEGVSP